MKCIGGGMTQPPNEARPSMEDETTKRKKPRSRQRWLTGGIPMFSRSVMYRRTAKYLKKKPIVKKEKKAVERFVVKEVGGEKNGGTRKVPLQKQPRYYPTQEGRRKLKGHRKPFSEHKRRLRPSITPGTVLILLAGVNRGRRVIFLKQLGTGLLLVTGPMKVNGIPMRRVNQRYVIATSTKLDISSVKIPGKLDDAYFKRKKLRTGKRSKNIFDDKKETYEVSDERRADQKSLDAQIIPLVKKEHLLAKYLQNPFSLRTRQYPHKMIF
ncbi:putative 60S ribosomal protein L6 isoform X2 [Apostichopus japonicus]|uniref:Large ribosomal subunit protein eL6 n=1 Tax=Stichopus japonicus TaxID=307972 RepID=A0A2G8L0L3_STIJA|nr:putative 60S ribosomal protein L6 isoform X2 [Apostichopus japonicus]